jgi:hypothetical protein
MAPQVGYIAYIDEAGDTGLKNIRTTDSPGASEWLVMAAVLVRAEREQEVATWTKQLIASLDQHQVRQLHFRELPEHKKDLYVANLHPWTCGYLYFFLTSGTCRAIEMSTPNALA